MKLRLLLASAIFLFSGMISRAQITVMYSQGFENGEEIRYEVVPASASGISTTLHAGGSSSLDLMQQTTGEVTLVLDTMDFTSNTTLNYIALEFDHICSAAPNGSNARICKIWYKRPGEEWSQMTGRTEYNMTSGTASRAFLNFDAFSSRAYSEWTAGDFSNTTWKSERFDLNSVFNGVPANERKLMIKFEVVAKTGAGATGHWWLDNIKVRASSSAMVKPTINMALYPDGYNHPNSRGARIMLDAKTSVSAGINPDSVYLFYRVGSDPTPIRMQLTPVVGVNNRYGGIIPFHGYDTAMAFYCVARDATGNANMVRFPASEGSWVDYRCVRGVAQPGITGPGFVGTNPPAGCNLPFVYYADNRSEFVYDSALMHDAGYGPGALTALRFTTATQYGRDVTRPRFQFRMKNAPTNYTVDVSVAEHYPFTSNYMHVVYDTALTVTQANAGDAQTIYLQDSFFYAGKDLVVQVLYDGDENEINNPVKMIATRTGKPTIWKNGNDAELGGNVIADPSIMAEGDWQFNVRPAFVFTETKNQPLLYDMGFDTAVSSPTYGLVSPNRDMPMTPDDHSVNVRLKNQGALTVNAIRISYSIDTGSNMVTGYYDWSGSLAGGATEVVTISPNVPLPAGFHTIKVWVEDTLTAAGQRIRDHEPYNDTIESEFIVCAGPMNGVRQIGGANADFGTIDQFLFSLSRCGIDDSLIVKLAPGEYRPFVLTPYSGGSTSNYLVFEALTDGVTFFADVTDSLAEASSIVNLEANAHVRFRNVNFVRRTAAAGRVLLSEMIKLGINSVDCRFEGCTFTDSVENPIASLRIGAMINSGFADSLYVNRCTFRGGKVGVNIRGRASDMRSSNNTVYRSRFYNQYENAIKTENQTNVVIEKNEMYDARTNSSYVLFVNECYGLSRIMANKVYTSHGAGGIGVGKVVGTENNPIVIANNMVVSDDDGTANIMSSPFDIIQATYAEVVYNSVKLNAPTRTNVATVKFGGGVLQNSRFLNNIVVCLDNTNYAFRYAPGYETTNVVGHNIYYAPGTKLNYKSGSWYADLEEWLFAEPSDTASFSVNPNFLDGSLVDLRTFNRQVKGVGMPLTSVTVDMFDTVRSTTATCPGAFEFVSLNYDFEPEAMINPVGETCNMPDQTELVVRLRNNGTSEYTGTGLTLSYQINGSTVHSTQVTHTVPADDTVTIATGQMLHLPFGTHSDSVYNILIWTTYSGDPNQTNDTNTFTVISKYRPSAPAAVTVPIQYATSATITPTLGVDTWRVYAADTAPTLPSTLYWYRNPADANAFFVGPTLVTDTIRQDTTIYFRQHRELPLIRITQVEFKTTGEGTTPNPPYWMQNSRTLSVQLTNVGDVPAHLEGDTLRLITAATNVTVKNYVFGDVTIAPGASLLVQQGLTSASLNPLMTVHTNALASVAFNANSAFIYKRNGVVEDAVAMNNVTTTALTKPNNWNAQQVPSYVWHGHGLPIPNTTPQKNTAGLIRVAFNGDSTDWRLATANDPMMLSSTDESWIMYPVNDCEGDMAAAHVTILAPPVADIDVSAPQFPEASCGMGLEDVTVRVRNYGTQTVNGLVLHYTAGVDTVDETVTDTISANGIITYTFNTPVNLSFPQDTTITLKVWADSVAGDIARYNDTNRVSVASLYTPEPPATLDTHWVSYGSRDTVTIDSVPQGVIPVWYDGDGNVVDTAYSSVSEILYGSTVRGVSYLVQKFYTTQVGTDSLTNAQKQYPSPYQPNNKVAKQQYIYSAHDLRSAGLQPGMIDTLSFYLDSIWGTATEVSFDNYWLGLGLTTDTIFANKNAGSWKATTEVFHRAPFTIHRTDVHGWVKHPLDVPFYWDGESSIVVQVSHEKSTAYTNGVQSFYTEKTKTTLHKTANAALSPSTFDYDGAATENPGNKRPNIRFNNYAYGCESEVSPYTVHIVNQPDVDLALLWPEGSGPWQPYTSCDSITFNVLVRNQGSGTASNVKVFFYLDTLAVDSVSYGNSISSGATDTVTILRRQLTPGRHSLTAVAHSANDSIASNDTISCSILVTFCGGTYTISSDSAADYHSFGEAIDTLNIAGIVGPVTFSVGNGIYQEQVALSTVKGASVNNTVTFVGEGLRNVLLTAATTQDSNYVFRLDSASYVTLRNFRIEARPTATGNAGNYANALVMEKGTNITLDNLSIKVKGTVNNDNASCVVLGDGISNLTIRNSTIDSGFYSIHSTGTRVGYSNILLENNYFTGFWKVGVDLRGINDLVIRSNRITSGVPNTTGRSLRGLVISRTSGTFLVEKNVINLLDPKNGGKMGMQLERIGSVSSNPGFIVNNMISCEGSGSADLPSGRKPSGIWLDSMSANVKVYYNTVRVNCATTSATTQYLETTEAFHASASVSNIQVMNNIFSNFSKGYAYYVAANNTVIISNFNGYYTESTHPFYWGGQFRANLAALQAANGDDANSQDTLQPSFVSVSDLHLVMTNFVSKAQYTDEVTDDIDGRPRMAIPAPTIGAHEMELLTHDMAVVDIIKPFVPVDTNFSYPNKMPKNIEGDSVLVVAKFYNNGRSIEDNVMWYAYIEGHEAQTRTPNKNLGTFDVEQHKFDSIMMPAPYGIINRHTVHVVVLLPGDTSLSDNDRTAEVFLAPAFNLEARTTSTASSDGCGRKNTILQLKVKNVGFKPITMGTPVRIGFLPQILTPVGTTVSTMPDTVEADITFPNQLLINNELTLAMPTSVNLYPTGLATDLTIRIKGWCHHDLDVLPHNDTIAGSTINSYFTPVPPVGYDTVLDYGTWGAVRASQENSIPIRWYNDSTSSIIFFPATNYLQTPYTAAKYNASTLWTNTPQYFDSAVYYLNCQSAKGCPSHFSKVTVRMAPRIPNDMAIEDVLAPLGSRVYMENDTVRVRVNNYGTSAQSNIPITYQLKRGNNVVQTVTDTIRATVAPDQPYEFTFRQLLNITTPTTAQTYTLNVWTDLSTDATRRNDTLRTAYTFRSLAESTYDPSQSGDPSFDVTRVSFNEIDLDMPPLQRGLTVLGTYNVATRDYPVLHVTRGLTDSLILEVTPANAENQRERCKVWVFIDYNRSGTFTADETLISGEAFYNDQAFRTLLSIANNASLGYMRMRIAVAAYEDIADGTNPYTGVPADKDGHTLDFLLFVDEHVNPTDIAVAQIVSPRSYLIRDELAKTVSFRFANKGSMAVTNPTFTYYFDSRDNDPADTTVAGTVTYTGTVYPGRSAIVSLPPHAFPYGLSTLHVYHNVEGDENYANDTIIQEYYRFGETTVILNDQFEVNDGWYAPSGRNLFTHNYWQLGTPNKTRYLRNAYSDANAWVTDIENNIVSGKRGNVSYLYSPIINIAQLKADTLAFYLRRNLINGSSLTVEFYSYENKWIKLDADSTTNWYNNDDDRVFDNTTSGNSYNRYWFKTQQVSDDFNEHLQFRFVYRTPIGTTATSAYGEGCAIDDFYLGRAQRQIDCGVVAIIEPQNPSYGQTIYPKVVVRNYGYDTLRSIQLGYIHYGTNLPKILNATCAIPPNGGLDTFLFTSPFVITSDYPETFDIKAFTNLTGDDLYRDNDTCTRTYSLYPLNNDISAHSFIYPLSSVIAGDTTVTVTLRIRNFGLQPLTTARLSYLVNGRNRIDEDVNFSDYLGRPLMSMEYFNYTFHHKLHAAMGIMRLTGIAKCDSNEYVYNDTVTKHVEGISSVTDLAATAVIVDTSDFNEVRFELVIDNRGARGANNFEVGFYIDNDTNTTYRETYYRAQPIPALTTAYHVFNMTLPTRPARYPTVTGFVHIQGDNDPANDTTSVIARQYIDLEVQRVIVEENAGPLCRTFIQIRNNGNLTLLPITPIQIRGTVNNVPLSFNTYAMIHAGETVHIELENTPQEPERNRVPKSPTRSYVGSGRVVLMGESNTTNNETTVVDVINYYDPSDAPVVDDLKLTLDQNYPNPFSGFTTIPFSLPSPANVRFFVIDAMGHVVNSMERRYGAGPQSITINMDAYPAGFYYYGIEVDGQRLMKKMIMR